MTRPTAIVFLVWLLASAAGAYEPTLNLNAIDEAVALGQSRVDAVRGRFHDGYRIHVGRPPVDDLDIVTPFRRVELAAEERARIGDRAFRQAEALAVAADYGDRLQLFVELTFHPLNTFVGVPSYVVVLAAPTQSARLVPADLQRIPRSQPRVGGAPVLPYPVQPALPSVGQPLVGGTIIATFDGARLDRRGAYKVVIEENGKELVSLSIDLGRLR
jgi:hypothetical protein